MEISKLETRSAASAGAFLHLRHPVTDELLYDEKEGKRIEVGVFVRGSESREVQERIQTIERRRMKEKDLEQKGIAIVSALVISFQGVERDGVLLTSSEADIKWFLSLSDSFVQQIMDFSKERENFFRG